jgi:hypothetical protein
LCRIGEWFCSDIRKLITAAHEAHFRTELWFALSKKSFRHNSYKDVLAALKVGRATFLQEAIAIRQNGKAEDNLEPEGLENDVYSSDDAVTVDEDML